MSIKSANHSQSGFSLFELLMTIAIVGVMGSVAIAAFGTTTDSVENARDRRNAQELAAVYITASAAGLDFVTANRLDETVRRIIRGEAPTGGAFKNRVFKVTQIGEADIAGAMRYLTIKNGNLVYSYDS